MTRVTPFPAVLAILCALVPGPLAAQGWIEPVAESRDPDGVVRVGSRVRVEVAGRVAHVEVTEWFRNRGSGVAEGHYLYPLPGEAVFDGFSLFMGDRELRGETMDAAEAREIYEAVVRSRKDPALIELAGHGLIRARVFPIEPGQTRKVTLRYDQLLETAGSALRFAYAAGVPRAGRSFPVRRLRERTGPLSEDPSERKSDDFELVVEDGRAFLDPFSPTHALDVERQGGRLRVRLADPLEGDLSVFLPLARERVGLTLATHRPAGEDGYFMLTLSPGRTDSRPEPRDVTVVMDVSGSMSGTKIEQAREALLGILESLGPDDRFRLAAFSNAVRVFRLEWSEAGSDERAEARRWIRDLRAEGGTNLEGALREAFRLSTPEARLPVVLFLTDGLPTVGEQAPERLAALAEARRGRARVFAFGVGHDVNTFLLDGLGAAGRGSTQYVAPGEEVERALGLLTAKIRHPVLTDLSIGRAPVSLGEVYPVTLPDLFAGEALVLFGRYRSPGGDREGRLQVTGRRAGKVERFTTDAAFPAHSEAHDYLPRLWASRKLGFLSRQMTLEGRDPEIEEEIRRTALRYGLLSEYTAHLVQEPGVVADRVVPDLPATPAAATGEGAVRRARRARDRREVQSATALKAMEEAIAREAAPGTSEDEASSSGGPGREGASRVVAGRLFVLRDGVWEDRTSPEPGRIVRVKPFSQAYFDLSEALPELRPYLRAFDAVAVYGDGVGIRIDPEGLERLDTGRLDRVVRDFRRTDDAGRP